MELGSDNIRLERTYKDVHDFDFTVERGKLFTSGTLPAKRTPRASVQFAQFLDEGWITPAEVIRRVNPEVLAELRAPQLEPPPGELPFAQGQPESAGIARGAVVLSSSEAASLMRRMRRQAKGQLFGTDPANKAVCHPGVPAIGESDVPFEAFHVTFVPSTAGICAHEGTDPRARSGWRSALHHTRTFTRLLVGIAALLLLGAGLWAMLSPESFYVATATHPPFNRHFVHSIGAFQLGLGSSLALALAVSDTLLVALAGNVVAALAHYASHFVDR